MGGGPFLCVFFYKIVDGLVLQISAPGARALTTITQKDISLQL